MSKLKYNSLKEAREKKKLTQQDVAKAAEIHESYYCLIENGNRPNVTIQTAKLISTTLGITLDEFFLHTNLTKSQVDTA